MPSTYEPVSSESKRKLEYPFSTISAFEGMFVVKTTLPAAIVSKRAKLICHCNDGVHGTWRREDSSEDSHDRHNCECCVFNLVLTSPRARYGLYKVNVGMDLDHLKLEFRGNTTSRVSSVPPANYQKNPCGSLEFSQPYAKDLPDQTGLHPVAEGGRSARSDHGKLRQAPALQSE